MQTFNQYLLKLILAFTALISLSGLTLPATAAPAHRLGIGANYWRTIDRIKEDDYKLDDTGVSWLLSYQHALASLLKLQVDMEIFPAGFGGSDEATYAPQAYLVLGSVIYLAGGIGIGYADGKFADEPFYALRAGLDWELFSFLHIDAHADYRFLDWDNSNLRDQLKNINTDTVMLGIALRLEF